jgi:hypothetical protein
LANVCGPSKFGVTAVRHADTAIEGWGGITATGDGGTVFAREGNGGCDSDSII